MRDDASWFQKFQWHQEVGGVHGKPWSLIHAQWDMERFESWPATLDAGQVEHAYARLAAHDSGAALLPARQAAELRQNFQDINRFYDLGDAPFPVGAPSEVELEASLRASNDLRMGVGGVPSMVLGWATRALGGTEQQVAGAAETGALASAMAVPIRMAGAPSPGAARPSAMSHPATPLTGPGLPNVARLPGTPSNMAAYDVRANVVRVGGVANSDPNNGLFFNKFPEHLIDTPKLVPAERLSGVSGKFNYAVLEDGQLVVGRTGHTSLTGGAPVQAAGEVKMYNDSIAWMDNASGHYQPPAATGAVAERAFNQIGIDATGKFASKVWVSNPTLPRGGSWVEVK